MKNPFKRPLRFGDREQIRAINIMNGDELYCPVCYAAYDPYGHGVGETCRQCRWGKLRAGAALQRAEEVTADAGA